MGDEKDEREASREEQLLLTHAGVPQGHAQAIGAGVQSGAHPDVLAVHVTALQNAAQDVALAHDDLTSSRPPPAAGGPVPAAPKERPLWVRCVAALGVGVLTGFILLALGMLFQPARAKPQEAGECAVIARNAYHYAVGRDKGVPLSAAVAENEKAIESMNKEPPEKRLLHDEADIAMARALPGAIYGTNAKPEAIAAHLFEDCVNSLPPAARGPGKES